MPKQTPERRIDRPSGAGRTSDYVAGATAAAGLVAHSHDGTANSGGVLAGYAPSVHTHLWAALVDPPETATRWPEWGEVTDKPAAFAPSAHSHAWADITSGVPDFATRWPTWGEVTSKPTTFAYTDAANVFAQNQTISKAAASIFVNATSSNPSIAFLENGVARWGVYYNVGSNYMGLGETGVFDWLQIKDNNGHLLLGTSSDLAKLTVRTDITTAIGIVVDTPASPTANLLELRNNGTAMFWVAASGSAEMQGAGVSLTLKATASGGSARPRLIFEGFSDNYFAISNQDDGFPKRLSIAYNALGSNEGINITDAHRIGLGTFNPAGRLDIRTLQVDTRGIYLQTPDNPTANLVELRNSATAIQFVVTAVGRVGIGTGAPSNPLTVVTTLQSLDDVGVMSATTGLRIVATGSVKSTTSGAAIDFVLPANDAGSNLYGHARIMALNENTIGSNATGMLILGTRQYFNKNSLVTNWYYNDTLIIRKNGVGIGGDVPIDGRILSVKTRTTSEVGIFVDTISGQTGLLLELRTNTDRRFSINPNGQIWTSQAFGMSAPGPGEDLITLDGVAPTGALPIYDKDGSLLGYAPLYASWF